MKEKRDSQQCKAHTKAGRRCKNQATAGPTGFCHRHVSASEDSTVVSAAHCPPNKSLFRLIVPEDKRHPKFELVRTAVGWEPARRMLDDVYQGFDDRDGNFLEQFQTTGFDERFFELYLFAYFSRSGFSIDRTHAVPDFLVERQGIKVAIEATTVNPPQTGAVKRFGRSLKDVSGKDARDYFLNELPIRFGSPLFSKLQKKYWTLKQCRDRPFVIAIEAFHEADAHLISDNSLLSYLYGSTDTAHWADDGKLEIQHHPIEKHQLGQKEIPSNFFGQPGTENVSAVVFSNSGTLGKFSRMGYQHGFGCETIDVSRWGFWFNPDPNTMDPTFMAYNLDAPPFVEPWGQGLIVFHNPACKYPLPRGYFVNAVQGYVKGGAFVAEHVGWHPIATKTESVHFGSDKQKFNELRWGRSPRLVVGAIPKREFMALCPCSLSETNPIADEQGWYTDETGSFLGVVLRDKTDEDWAWVILARDEHFVSRCIDVQSSLPTRDEARIQVQFKIAELLASPRRIFATGHPGGQ